MQKHNRIAILTGGGDCPGLNAVIRSVAKKAILNYGMEVIGIEDGFEGVIQKRYRKLSFEDVSGIITLGGTILGTSNTANPYRHAVKSGNGFEFKDVSKDSITTLKDMDIDCLVCIGGDGTLSIAHQLMKDGIPVVGVPKTIDNDIIGTDITFGFDSAVACATDGIDRLHTTAQSHHRAMLVEVMGRNAGWIALYSGVASGADVILLPEIPYNLNVIAERVKERSKRGKRYTIIVVSEGAKPVGGNITIQHILQNSPEAIRLGGVGNVLREMMEKSTGIESRTVILGHLQRSGVPTAFDRVLATKLGARAVEMLAHGKFGFMVGVQGNNFVDVPLEIVAAGQRNVPVDDPLIKAARSVGTCFGDVG